ncbi:hypothetical protein DACRYDRAFT_116076 [Dacryopinax primogenitus]|uniref:Uncharacterized protein n=1 Tax=Dacryopinax primogenitus (strain DJM 731) TaxID=1858805 RepID=M5FWN8_DACPD|nr:uncharacterized protein DACRYDRAFT_116076 [Dacryopinax primogenitus]EJU02366.1 hypothetical protein DACRYDRAFT_116076 [Dacryopinax primogenitus]
MSGRGGGGRGGRGGRGGGRGGFGRGRGSFGGPSLPPGVDFRDIQASMAAPSAQYPPMDIPSMTPLEARESKAVQYQVEIVERMKGGKYWIVEEQSKRNNEIERWFDHLRQKEKIEVKIGLRAEDLNQEFFPASLWDGYFNPTKKQRVVEPKKQKRKRKLDIDALGIDDKDGEGKANDDDLDDDEEEQQDDYDVEDLEGGDDYEANYFDNGEADDDDDGNDDGDRGDYD